VNPENKNIKQHTCSKSIIESVLHYYIFPKRLCNTEDRGNDAENSALHYLNKLSFKIYSNRK